MLIQIGCTYVKSSRSYLDLLINIINTNRLSIIRHICPCPFLVPVPCRIFSIDTGPVIGINKKKRIGKKKKLIFLLYNTTLLMFIDIVNKGKGETARGTGTIQPSKHACIRYAFMFGR